MAGINAALGLGGGVAGYFKHNDYADLIEDQELNMPGSMGSAESIYQGLASQGLPGKETIQAGIESAMPSTINTAKEVVDSPSALLDLLSRSSASTAEQTRNLGVQDAQARVGNEAMLADFYTRAKAPLEMRINEFDIQKTLDAERERMMGLSELLGGASQAGNIGMQYFANKESNEQMQGFMDQIYGGGDGGGVISGSASGKVNYKGSNDGRFGTPEQWGLGNVGSNDGGVISGSASGDANNNIDGFPSGSVSPPAPPDRNTVWGLTKQYLEAMGQYSPQAHAELQDRMFQMNGMPAFDYNDPSAMYKKPYWLSKGKSYNLPWGGTFVAE
jgi:hypothetical protein